MARSAARVPRPRMRRIMQSLVVIATVACLPAVSCCALPVRLLRLAMLQTHSPDLHAKSAMG